MLFMVQANRTTWNPLLQLLPYPLPHRSVFEAAHLFVPLHYNDHYSLFIVNRVGTRVFTRFTCFRV